MPTAAKPAKLYSFDWSAAIDKSRQGNNILQLLTVERTFGTEELSSCSPHLNSLEPEPCLFIHREDAKRLGLEDGDIAVVTTESGSLSVKARISDNMRAGVLILPRLNRINWQQLGAAPVSIAFGQIQKIE